MSHAFNVCSCSVSVYVSGLCFWSEVAIPTEVSGVDAEAGGDHVDVRAYSVSLRMVVKELMARSLAAIQCLMSYWPKHAESWGCLLASGLGSTRKAPKKAPAGFKHG